jgi:hypothetical protein
MSADSASASHWPPVLLLADLYSQALLTMGDDEFFGSSPSSTSSSRAVRNPLTLDKLVSFSKRLLNIACTMYWREDQSIIHEVYVSSQVRFMGNGRRDGEKMFKRLLSNFVHLFLFNSSAHGGVKHTQTICTCGSLARHIPA